MALIVPVGHRLAGRRRVELTELADEPFVETTPDWGTRVAIDRAFIRAPRFVISLATADRAVSTPVREFLRVAEELTGAAVTTVR
jgi:hypothetical protein